MNENRVFPIILAALLIYFLGASVGSFLMVVYRRRGSGRSWAKGRSVCEHCGRELRWWEMIPSVSYPALRGKCSRCKAPIDPSHFIGETVCGLLFELVFWLVFLPGRV